MKRAYVVRVSGTYTDGTDYAHYIKAIRSLFVDMTENLRDAATFQTKKDAGALKNEYLRVRGNRQTESVDIIQTRS